MIFCLVSEHLTKREKQDKRLISEQATYRKKLEQAVNGRQNQQQQDRWRQKIAAHRGVSAHYPENTWAAFEAARQASVQWIETDVSMLQDETLIIFHDDRQGRTVSGDKLVAESLWADFADADAGVWKDPAFAGQPVPLLADLLVWGGQQGLRLNLEIKCHGSRQERTAQQLASVLQQTATDGIVVSSFDVYFLQILRQSMPDLRLASIHDEPVQMSKLLAETPAIEAVHLKHSLIRSPDDVAVFHDKGLDLRAWTVNDADRAVQLFDWGVDMVISDDPEQISSAAF